MNQSNLTSLHKNGWYKHEKFIKKAGLRQIEKDILLTANVESKEELNEKIIELDENNRKDLFELNKCMSSHYLIKSLHLNLISSLGYRMNLVPIYLGGRILLGLPCDSRLTYSWHQESNYMPGFNRLINAWIPLFSANDEGNGTMTIIDKSSRYGKLPYTRIDKEQGYCDLVTNVENIDGEIVICNGNAGDAYIFDQNTIHRSNLNSSSKVRYSVTVRVAYIDGARKVDGFKDYY